MPHPRSSRRTVQSRLPPIDRNHYESRGTIGPSDPGEPFDFQAGLSLADPGGSRAEKCATLDQMPPWIWYHSDVRVISGEHVMAYSARERRAVDMLAMVLVGFGLAAAVL